MRKESPTRPFGFGTLSSLTTPLTILLSLKYSLSPFSVCLSVYLLCGSVCVCERERERESRCFVCVECEVRVCSV